MNINMKSLSWAEKKKREGTGSLPSEGDRNNKEAATDLTRLSPRFNKVEHHRSLDHKYTQGWMIEGRRSKS